MIIVTELIKNQIHEALFMFAAGLAFMIFYEIISFVKHKARLKKISCVALELTFWIFASFLTGAFLYKCSYGQLSFHAFCAFAFGVFLWKKVFYGIIDAGDLECSKEKPAEAGNLKETIK